MSQVLPYRLIVESPIFEGIESVYIEEKNRSDKKSMYVQGPMLMANQKNRNGRIYPKEEMSKEVDRYIKEFVKTSRALGELNHPNEAEVNLQNACHMVSELTENGDFYIGKAKVLSTPAGKIMENLIHDGVKLGMSSRALGKVDQKGDTAYVSDMKLIAIDCVADPSAPTAFVNGILESKSYILNKEGKLEVHYANFEKSLANIPNHNRNQHIQDAVVRFIQALGKS